MPNELLLVGLVVALALLFDFTNGWNDSANAVATVIGTRVLKPLHAVLLAAVLNFAGAFFSTEVARTIGKEIVDLSRITLPVIAIMLIGGIVWNAAMTWLGMPISASHALIGGMAGAAIAHGGFGLLKASGILTILAAMLLSPVLGAVMGFLLMKLLKKIAANFHPSQARKRFSLLQILSVSFMSFSHGAADAQKVMGIIMMALVAGGAAGSMDDPIPLWVIASCGLMMALGTAVGGWKVIRTLGMRLGKLEPIHGFAAETAAAILLTTIAKIGVPVSTTHTITGSIIGIGMTHGIHKVRWGIAGKIVYAWIFTLPGAAMVSFLSYHFAKPVFDFFQ